MFVNDRQELIATPCEQPFISRERRVSVVVSKPCRLRSRVSRIHESILGSKRMPMHNKNL